MSAQWYAENGASADFAFFHTSLNFNCAMCALVTKQKNTENEGQLSKNYAYHGERCCSFLSSCMLFFVWHIFFWWQSVFVTFAWSAFTWNVNYSTLKGIYLNDNAFSRFWVFFWSLFGWAKARSRFKAVNNLRNGKRFKTWSILEKHAFAWLHNSFVTTKFIRMTVVLRLKYAILFKRFL